MDNQKELDLLISVLDKIEYFAVYQTAKQQAEIILQILHTLKLSAIALLYLDENGLKRYEMQRI